LIFEKSTRTQLTKLKKRQRRQPTAGLIPQLM
jgi:hypothetical protein